MDGHHHAAAPQRSRVLDAHEPSTLLIPNGPNQLARYEEDMKEMQRKMVEAQKAAAASEASVRELKLDLNQNSAKLRATEESLKMERMTSDSMLLQTQVADGEKRDVQRRSIELWGKVQDLKATQQETRAVVSVCLKSLKEDATTFATVVQKCLDRRPTTDDGARKVLPRSPRNMTARSRLQTWCRLVPTKLTRGGRRGLENKAPVENGSGGEGGAPVARTLADMLNGAAFDNATMGSSNAQKTMAWAQGRDGGDGGDGGGEGEEEGSSGQRGSRDHVDPAGDVNFKEAALLLDYNLNGTLDGHNVNQAGGGDGGGRDGSGVGEGELSMFGPDSPLRLRDDTTVEITHERDELAFDFDFVTVLKSHDAADDNATFLRWSKLVTKTASGGGRCV